MIVVWIFPIIYRYGQFFGYTPGWLAVAASSVRLQGFLDAIAYGLTEGLIRRWSNVFHSWFCCRVRCGPSDQDTPSDDTSSFRPAISNRSHDSSSIIFSEGYLWDRLVPDVPGSTYSSSISESGYYTPLTSHHDIPIASRDRDFLNNPLDTKHFPYKYSTG